MICKNKKCLKEFDPKTYNQKFCSIRCRNQQNIRAWNEKNSSQCLNCQKKIKPKAKYCKKCLGQIKSELYKDKTLKEYRQKLTAIKKHPSWANVQVRQFARSWNKHLLDIPCQKCGYKPHIELAHIKGIADFSLNTKLREINDESNLLVLCPNHHWEFDNGYLDILDIPARIRT